MRVSLEVGFAGLPQRSGHKRSGFAGLSCKSSFVCFVDSSGSLIWSNKCCHLLSWTSMAAANGRTSTVGEHSSDSLYHVFTECDKSLTLANHKQTCN